MIGQNMSNGQSPKLVFTLLTLAKSSHKQASHVKIAPASDLTYPVT
jgi:hypothetical protein